LLFLLESSLKRVKTQECRQVESVTSPTHPKSFLQGAGELSDPPNVSMLPTRPQPQRKVVQKVFLALPTFNHSLMLKTLLEKSSGPSQSMIETLDQQLGDACNPDGSFKDATEIPWWNSPSDEAKGLPPVNALQCGWSANGSSGATNSEENDDIFGLHPTKKVCTLSGKLKIRLSISLSSVAVIQHPTISTKHPNEASYQKGPSVVLATTARTTAMMTASILMLQARLEKVLGYWTRKKEKGATTTTINAVRS
jgi:hypothetical protein